MIAERNAYLREMGIDVYLPRDQVTAETHAIQPLSARRLAASRSVGVVSPVAVSGSEAVASQPAASREAAPRAAEPREAALQPSPSSPQADGLRAALAASAPVAGASDVAPVTSAATDLVETAVSAVPADRPEFLLSLLTYPAPALGLSLIFYQPGAVRTLSSTERAFADAVAASVRSLQGGQAGEPTFSEVRWPMVQSDAIPQTQTEARAVVQAKLKTCNPILLVFGAAAMPYVLPENLLALPVGPGVPLTWGDRQIWQVPALEDCLANAGAKRSLWRILAGILTDAGS